MPSQYATGNGVLSSAYLSPLKMHVMSYNVKIIISINIAWWWAEALFLLQKQLWFKNQAKNSSVYKGLRTKIKNLKRFLLEVMAEWYEDNFTLVLF